MKPSSKTKQCSTYARPVEALQVFSQNAEKEAHLKHAVSKHVAATLGAETEIALEKIVWINNRVALSYFRTQMPVKVC